MESEHRVTGNALAVEQPLSVGYVIGMMAVVGAFFCMPLWFKYVLRPIRNVLAAAWNVVPWPSIRGWRELRRQRRKVANVQLLGEYLSRFASCGASEQYFHALAASDMKPKRLRAEIERHLVGLERAKIQREVESALADSVIARELQELRAKHDGLLAEAEVELAVMRNQRQLISGLVDRLNDKYSPSEVDR